LRVTINHSPMKRDLFLFFSISMLFLSIGNTYSQSLKIPDELFSRAEKTGYLETSLSADVAIFCEKIGELSNFATVKKFGKTKDGNDLIMVILSNPRVSSPAEAKASGKPVIYIQGNIHAGEVEGKEASIQLIREICFGPKQNLIDNQIVIFCPNYNPDGNDKLSNTSRPSQAGSPEMTGVRASGEGYDLNREGIKNEAIEMRSLLSEIILKWDPVLLVDLHTDNGSWHGYALNYAPAFLSAGMPSTTGYVTDKLLPEITNSVLERSGLPFFYHGYMSMRQGQQTTFATYSHLPRYIVNYMGLRNRMAILSETFAHDRFEKRVVSNYYLLVSILEFTNLNGPEMMEVVKKADEETIKLVSENKGDLKRGVQFTMAAEPEPIKLLIRETESYRDDAGRTRTRPTGRTYWIDSVKHSNHFEPRVMAGVPQGYYFPSQLSKVAEKLREHGITVVTVPKKVKLDAEIYTITKFTRAARPAYGDHRTVTTEGAFSLKQVTVDAGSYFVDIKQPLAWLIMYMLEPQSDDGLLYWNYFDDYLLPKEVETRSVDYPVFKLVEPVK
jgi:hypothetical protein